MGEWAACQAQSPQRAAPVPRHPTKAGESEPGASCALLRTGKRELQDTTRRSTPQVLMEEGNKLVTTSSLSERTSYGALQSFETRP